MQHHPVTETFAMIDGVSLQELADDIRAVGLKEPIWLDTERRIIDERNRYQVCEMAGVEPQFRVWDQNGESLVAFVLSLNLRRRHLTASQRAMVAAEAEPLFAEEAKKRQREHGGTAPGRKSVVQKVAQLSEPSRARDEAARIAGVNRQYVSDAKRIAEQSPEVAARVRSGQLTIRDAKREVKREAARHVAKEKPLPSEDAAIIAGLKAGKAMVLNEERHAHAMARSRVRAAAAL